MDVDRLTVALEHHARLLSDAARSVELDAPVPTCPGWTVRDLVVHTGIVHRHKTEVVRGSYVDGPPDEPPEPVGDVVAWYNEGVDEMLTVFGDADLSAPSWTWCSHEHNAEWWVRRMAQETLIHGADALIAAGRTPEADAWLAVDGVDEILDEMLTGGPDWATIAPLDRRIDLLADDRMWSLRTAALSGVSPTTGSVYEGLDTLVHDDSGSPDATIRTDPATLDFWLWGRGDLPDDAIEGDRSLVDHLRAVASEGTQ
jgi:uncharacterized protein (TIGR03083 family)